MKNTLVFLIVFGWALLAYSQTNLSNADLESDSTRQSADALRQAERDAIALRSQAAVLEMSLGEDELADLDHEEFGDWIAMMPGFYPLDHAAFGAPYRGLIMGLSPATVELNYRGRSIENHLSGGPELGWVAPEALSRVRYQPWSTGGAGAQIQAVLRALEPAPPSSRVAVRDGYYGLGTVDFDLVQKIAPPVVLNGGGRVATYDGRVFHSEGYGLNLRSEVTFQADQDLSGWAGIAQGKLNSQIPETDVSYDRDRYEADVALQYRTLSSHLFGIQQRETYGNGSDGWDELGWMGRWLGKVRILQVDFGGRVSAARWKLEGLPWSATTFGDLQLGLGWQPKDPVKLNAILGLNISDDFAPARHLGLSSAFAVLRPMEMFLGISQSQRVPSRFESAADFEPAEHYIPFDPVLYQNPDLAIAGDRSLDNETYTTGTAGIGFRRENLQVALSAIWRQVDDPIVWHVVDSVLMPYNGTSDQAAGALGWLMWTPLSVLDWGITGSFLPKDAGETRLFPEIMAHAWTQYRQKLFSDQLELRLRVGADYYGEREAPFPGGWENWGDVLVVNGRISARILGAFLFWGVNNLFSQDYQLLPGHLMMHKEEVWGVAWSFRN